MKIEINNAAHLPAFVRLNEQWITEHFSLEDADRALAANPGKVIENGGFVFSLHDDGQVVGVCALFKESPERFQLARMAVEPSQRGQGHGRTLMARALEHAAAAGAKSVYLLSNTALEAAIALYKNFGFSTVSTGQHPVYARSNIVMERQL
ncbi:MAG: GNAT family N-acetyltransferase [Azonexus sp.]|jgi:N-acetylglutamate synthase-like GNAT family acetyltransferase|nr:GNAT family N-acetyltransferase [Azonexus sp.]